VPAVLGTATGCEVLRASKPQSKNGLEPRIPNATARICHPVGAAISIEKRVPWPPAGKVASKNPVDLPLRLDDALVRRLQLHRAYISEQ